MKSLLVCFSVLLFAAFTMIGCGGNSGATGIPSAQIQARLNPSGLLEAWPNAIIDANVNPSTALCQPYNDPHCSWSFSQQADANGNYTFQTNAIPGTWTIAALSDKNCSSATGSDFQVSAGGSYQLVCGQVTNGYIAFSPAYCTITTYQSDGSMSSDCPPTITGSVTVNTFPTGRSLVVGNYSPSGSTISSQNQTFTSATSFTVPTPTSGGYTAIIVRDPTTNQVLGAGQFQIKKVIVRCTPRTC